MLPYKSYKAREHFFQSFRAVSIIFYLYSYIALITVASDYFPGPYYVIKLPYLVGMLLDNFAAWKKLKNAILGLFETACVYF